MYAYSNFTYDCETGRIQTILQLDWEKTVRSNTRISSNVSAKISPQEINPKELFAVSLFS
jgi:hypothetical protein